MDDYLLTRFYDDVDALCSEARHWNLDLVPTGGTMEGSDLVQARSGPVEIGRGRFRASLIQEGAPPAGHWTFVVPARSEVAFLWRGQRVRGDSILVFPVGGELYAVSEPSFDVFTVSIEEEHLGAVAAGLQLPTPRRLTDGAEVFAAAPSDLAVLRRTLRVMSQAVVLASARGDACLARGAFAELPALLLGALARATSRVGGPPMGRLLVVRAATELMAGATEASTPDMEALAAGVGTSSRTLRRAFDEVYGRGPKSYLLARRYDEARRMLRDGDPLRDRVNELAGRLGFWHQGRFAHEYRRRFGELPSATLNAR